jgi:hypothetical protein
MEYSASYSGMHKIRYLGYKAQNGRKDFGEFMTMQHGRMESDTDHAIAMCYLHYPNLFWHSDCEGSYTLRGKVDLEESGKLLTGNSRQLLWELNDIARRLGYDADNQQPSWELFVVFRELVKDVVENHDGKLEFH